MKDTPPAIEQKFRQMLMGRSGEEHLKMGCSMHATAQALAKASISQQHPGARPAELKRLLFLHFYGADFEPEERKRIASALARRGRADDEERNTLIKLYDRGVFRCRPGKRGGYGKMGKRKANVLGKYDR